MDKEELYQKAEKVINQAFEVAKSSVRTVSEKAGEAAHVTKLLIEKASLEHRVSKKFAELGHKVYDIALRSEGKKFTWDDKDIQRIIEETHKLDGELAKVESTLTKERRKKKIV